MSYRPYLSLVDSFYVFDEKKKEEITYVDLCQFKERAGVKIQMRNTLAQWLSKKAVRLFENDWIKLRYYDI